MNDQSPPVRLFHAANSPEVEQAVLDVLRSGQIASGPLVEKFEREVEHLVARKHAVATSDMSAALVLALQLASVGPGDDVLTLPFSCMSSNSPIALVGATPVWVDIDPTTASMSVADFERALTPRTKAVLLYHVAGYPGPSAEIAEHCRARGIVLIEDCNNALGAWEGEAPVGRHGDYAVYSFYPNRQVNALEGGMLICPNAETRQRAARLRRFGIDPLTFRDRLGEISPASDIPEIGPSASMSQLHAAAGLAQLPRFEDQRRQTLKIAARLADVCRPLPGVRVVHARPGALPAYWGFLLLSERRDALIAALKSRGIQTSKLHHRNDDYSGFGSARRPLPGTDMFMAQVLALPCGWWIDASQAERIASALAAECAA